jgi:acyl dehydratase
VLDIGDELPAVTVDLSADFVAAYAREIGMDFGRYTDHAEARAQGLPGQIAPGNLSLSLMARCLLHWAPGTRLKRIGTTFRGLALTGQTVVIRGNVVERHEHADHTTTLECDVWMENAEGERLVVGTATLERYASEC